MAVEEQHSRPVDGRSLKILIALLTGALVFLMAARTPLDTDFWWHIRAGETSWKAAAPLLTDQFTFTRTGQPWINHSWLAEVILYLVYQGTGYFGVGLLVAALATASMLLVFVQLKGNDLIKSAIIILASIVAAPVWSPRPQLFTLVLFAGVYLVISQYRQRGIDRLWLLPPLFLLWSNLHAGYTLGFLLLGAVIGGELFNMWLHKPFEQRSGWRRIRKIMLWTMLCALVVLINPNGLDAWLAPFKTVSVAALRQTIDEWASPDFHQIALQPFLWLLFALLAAVGLSARKMDAVDLLGVIGFAYLAFLAKRNFAPFALFAAPVLARHLTAAIHSWQGDHPKSIDKATGLQKWLIRMRAKPVPPRLRAALNITLVVLVCLAALVKLVAVTAPAFVEQAAANYFPQGAVAYLQREQSPGRIFNSYGWGGYLEWHLRGFPVFIDGRTDLFGDEITGEWIATIQAGEGWQDSLAEWQIDYCLIEPDRPLAASLREAGAAVLYEDQTSVLFRIAE